MNIGQRLARLHNVSLYLVVLLSYLACTFGGGVGPVMALLFPLLLGLSALFHRAGLARPEHNRWWSATVLGFIAFSGIELLTGANTEIVGVAIRFVLVLQLIKMFSRLSARDDLQVYALSFLALAAATVVNQGVSFGILFGLYVLIGTFSLALFHLRNEVNDRLLLLSHQRIPFDRLYVGVLATLSLAIFAASLAIFFAFPRVGLGFFMTQSRDPVSVTGFSENVELGGHGVIRDNPEVVLRVEFPDGPPVDTSNLHWRTMTFDHYDGRKWSRSMNDNERPVWGRRNRYRLERLHPPALRAAAQGSPRHNLRIYLEPIGTNLLPVLWPGESLTLGPNDTTIPFGPRSGSVTVDSYGDLRHTIESQIGVTYELRTLPIPPSELFDVEEQRPMPDHLLEKYLQLPDLPERTLALARSITEGERTHYARARAIQAYLAQNFSYTTDLPPVGDDDPVTSFLFETRRGHCEYFATSAVVLLRAAGVPARLVNGFLGGTWNNVGNYLAVRQGDAHSWVEIFVPEYGWVPLDPTPPAESAFARRNFAVAWLSNVYDAARMSWMKWVIEYDLEAQIAIFRRASSTLAPRSGAHDEDGRRDRDRPGDDSGLPTRDLIAWAGFATIVAGAHFAGTKRRTTARTRRVRFALVGVVWTALGTGWIAWFYGADSAWTGAGVAGPLFAYLAGAVATSARDAGTSAEATALFRRLERAAARTGLTRRPDQGPAAFFDQLAERIPDAARDVALFKARYLAMRFGGQPFDADDLTALKRTLKRIEAALARG